MDAKQRKSVLWRYLLTNAVIGAAIGLFLLLDRFDLFDGLIACPWLILGLYCPTCGMTRAAHALLRLDFVAAVSYHIGIFPLIATVLYYELVYLRRVLAKRPEDAPRVRRFPAFFLLGFFILFFLARNLLLLAGLDPTGDLLT